MSGNTITQPLKVQLLSHSKLDFVKSILLKCVYTCSSAVSIDDIKIVLPDVIFYIRGSKLHCRTPEFTTDRPSLEAGLRAVPQLQAFVCVCLCI